MANNFNHKSIREKQEELAKLQEEQRKEASDKIKGVVTRVLDTEDGVELFKVLYAHCGTGSVLRAGPNGQSDGNLTHVMIGRRSVYEEIRQFIPDNKLVAVEREALK
jgi:hypothetical protein